LYLTATADKHCTGPAAGSLFRVRLRLHVIVMVMVVMVVMVVAVVLTRHRLMFHLVGGHRVLLFLRKGWEGQAEGNEYRDRDSKLIHRFFLLRGIDQQ
jgi:hypothetical protein